LVYDIASNSGIDFDESKITEYSGELIVTPRDIDENIRDMAKVIGYGINLAIQDITINEINMLLS